jgi:phospholipid/cholesterol/gamma-HCH transport system permease protein
VPNIEGTLLLMNHYDLISAILKAIVIGFFIGIVACQKGLSARGGAEGVGRAVSQAVVVTFLGMWVINTVWNQAFFTLFPDALGLAG